MADEEKVDRRRNNPLAGRPPGRKNNSTVAKENRQDAQQARRLAEAILKKTAKTNQKAETIKLTKVCVYAHLIE